MPRSSTGKKGLHTNLLNAAHFYPVERMGLPRVLVRKESLEAFKRAQDIYLEQNQCHYAVADETHWDVKIVPPLRVFIVNDIKASRASAERKLVKDGGERWTELCESLSLVDTWMQRMEADFFCDKKLNCAFKLEVVDSNSKKTPLKSTDSVYCVYFENTGAQCRSGSYESTHQHVETTPMSESLACDRV